MKRKAGLSSEVKIDLVARAFLGRVEPGAVEKPMSNQHQCFVKRLREGITITQI